MKGEREKRRLSERIFAFFYPEQCALCKACGHYPLCPSCREALEEGFAPKRFLAPGGNGFADGMMCLFSYDHLPAKILILEWKHHRFRDYPLIFGDFVRRPSSKRCLFGGIDVVAFAPRSRAARRKAGFDQAEELAKEVARVLEVPFEPLLTRCLHSKPQHNLSAEERRANVHQAFRARHPLAGETVLLVDDIVTTGAGTRECARILKKAGAQKVFVFCLAASCKEMFPK